MGEYRRLTRRWRCGSRQWLDGPGPAARSAEPTTLGGFKPGDRVLHARFGQGQVINVKNLSDDQDVTVKFQDGVVRTLSANFAKLQKR